MNKFYRIISAYNLNGYSKEIYYKGLSFMIAYSSEGKVWKTVKGAEKALLNIDKRMRLTTNNYLGIEDGEGNVVKWYDRQKKSFIG